MVSKFFNQLERIDIDTDDDVLLEEVYKQDKSYVIQAVIANNIGYYQQVTKKFDNIDDSVIYGFVLESINCALTEYTAEELDHSYKATAREILENKIMDYYKKQNRIKRGGDAEFVSIDVLQDCGQDPSYKDTYNIELKDNIMSSELTGIQKKICLYTAEKYSTKDIAEILGVSRQNIEKHYEKISQKVGNIFI